MTFEMLLADNDVPQQKRRIIRVVNMLSISTAITVFILGPYLYSITGYTSILYPALVEGTLFMIVPLLNKLGRHKTALHLMFIIHTVAVGYYTLILGPESNNLAFSVFLCAAAVTIFSNHKARAIAIIVIMLIAAFVDTSHNNNIIPILNLDSEALKNLDLTVKISVIVLTVTILYSHDLESRLNEREKESMRSRLDWLNKELDSLNKSLDIANKSKSVYVRNTVHDLRAPMNVILKVVQEYEKKKELKSETVQLTFKDFDDLYSSGMNLLEIINNTLDWARIEAGEQEELKVTNFRPGQWLSTKFHALKRLAPVGKDVKLYVDTGNLPPSIMIDETKLRRILTNLLSNAFKFTRNGTPVLVKGYVENGLLVFSVTDNGRGIPEHMIDTIFTPFYTENNQQTESTGVGLPIVKEYVRILDGDIFIKSEIGVGTTFKIVLPLVISDQEIEEEEEEKTAPTYQLKDKSVMVIDDNEIQLRVTNHYLTKLGASIYTFHKKEEGLWEVINLVDTFQPDLVLVDHHMPIVSGKEILINLLEHPRCCNIPIIIISGDAFQEAYNEIMDLGATGYIRKPLVEQDFNKAIYEALYPKKTDSKVSA